MAKRRPFTEPLTDEEHELVRRRAHAIWKARSDDGKTSAGDDWTEAIEQLRAEHSMCGLKVLLDQASFRYFADC